MQLVSLIDGLSQPAAYPFPVQHVEVCQTHISVVFLAGPFAYKIKKPVNLGFLDFTTKEKRRYFCEEEVRLNHRLAPSVYLGIVPVVETNAGLRVEEAGEAVEWAVKMARLPEEATLRQRLLRGEIDSGPIRGLARRIAGFHAEADVGPHVAAFGRYDVVAQNALENFKQSAPQVGITVSRAVFERVQALTQEALHLLRPLIDARARQGPPRDTHGDLHLDHVYLFPDRPAPADLIIVDCIEFNERFRFADPVADMAFLVMDLLFHGRKDLARVFAEEYFAAAADDEGRALLPFYVAYRASVRAKVEGMKILEKEVPQAERTSDLAKARAHWLLALGELETPGHKPCLVLIGGLPGTGKSTLARKLVEKANFHMIRSDAVRKALADLPPGPVDLYSAEWTERTYQECLRRAEELLCEGQRALVDASFHEEKRRLAFLEMANRLAVPVLFLWCRAAPEIAQARLKKRLHDVSDADGTTFQAMAARWEPCGDATRHVLREVQAGGTMEETLQQALGWLREFGL
jgi:aminoglycoside phosphotransferase family enzyme/predicted kinase